MRQIDKILNDEIGDRKKSQNTVTKMKYSVNGLNSRMEMTEERIAEVEDCATEIMLYNRYKRLGWGGNEQRTIQWYGG